MTQQAKTHSKPLRLAIILLLVGILAKILYWPYAEILLDVGIVGIALFYLLRFSNKINKKLLDYAKVIFVVSWSISSILSFHHLPYVKIFQNIYAVSFIVTLILMISTYFSSKEEDRESILSIGLHGVHMIGIVITVIGVLMKIMHWPAAEILIMIGFCITIVWTIKGFSQKPAGVKNKNYLQSENIKGSVTKITEFTYEIKSGMMDKLLYSTISSINKEGNRYLVEDFDENGRNNGTCKFEHDRRNNITAVINYDEKGGVKSDRRMKYDDKNNRIQHTMDSKSLGKMDSIYLFKYDDKGNAIEEIFYSSDGSIYSRDENTFDEKGKVIKKVSYREGKLYHTRFYKYDSTGNILERKETNPKGEQSDLITYRYDKNNNLLEEIHYSWDGSVFLSYTHRYEKIDTNGNWTVKYLVQTKREDRMIVRKFEYAKTLKD